MKKQLLLGLMAMLLPLTSWAQSDSPFKIALTKTSTPYDGGKTQPEFTVTFEGEDTPMAGGDYEATITLNGNKVVDNKVTNVGTYTITVKGTGRTASLTPATATFDVTHAQLTLTEAVVNKDAKIQYGTSDEDLKISDFVTLTTANGVVENNDTEIADALKCLSLRKVADDGQKVGDPFFMVVEAATSNGSTNYEYKGDKISFAVDIDKKVLTLSLKEAKREYDGKTTEAKDLIKGLDFVAGDADAVKVAYTVTKDGEDVDIKNAGEYTIEVALDGEAKGNYEIKYAEQASALTYTIDRKVIDIKTKEGIELTKVYDGNVVSKNDVDGFFTIDQTVEGDDITIAMLPSGGTKTLTDAGSEVSIAPYVNGTKQIQSKYWSAPENNYDPVSSAPAALSNYAITIDGKTTSSGLPKFTIKERPVKYYFEGGEKTYDNKAETTPIYTVAVLKGNNTGFVGEDDGFEVEPVARFADGVTDVKNATDEGYALVEDTDETENITFKNGSKNYIAEFVAAPTAEQLPEDAKHVNVYMINKVELIVKALDKTVKYGTDLSELEEYLKIDNSKVQRSSQKPVEGANIERGEVAVIADWTGILKLLGETLAIADGVDAKTVGTKEKAIVFNVEKEKVTYPNYEITLVEGDLIVEGEPVITLDRDAIDDEEEGTESVATTLAAYNGAEDMTVILGGSRNLQADYWYTLVLPFETSVREISNAFGYAIVDVPNEDNQDKGVVSFKLKVDAVKIPANTLLLIKTDEAINLNDQIEADKAVKFVNKKIEYNPEYFTLDGAGNEYYGVYKNIGLTEHGDWYLSGGKFYNAGAVYDKYGTPVPVSALGGYVRAVAGAAARILVEEADGSTTSINAITGETVNSADSWYSVGGMKLNAQPTQKGVYINNGKKVVIK